MLEEKRSTELQELEQRIGYTFQNRKLLRLAVTHSSYANELSRHLENGQNNQRLEFLGDAVLELVTSEFIYENHEEMSEGKLSKLRASLVCEPSLAFCARKLSLGSYLLLGKGEDATGGRERDSILSDALEAVIGSVYLDGGLAAASEVIHQKVLGCLEQRQCFVDSKSYLQEMCHSMMQEAPVYVLVEEKGPAHKREFVMEVRAGGRVLAVGSGQSKKAAEQQAAYEAICLLKKEK